MRAYHTKCGGEIDVKARRCRRCKKKWDPVSFRLDPTGIRPMLDKRGRTMPDEGRPTPKEGSPLPWWSSPEAFVSKLPKWPKWARVVTTVVVVGLAILVIYLIRR